MSGSKKYFTDGALIGLRWKADLREKLKRGAAHVWLRAGCGLSLVSITARPPMLAKHEKWHEIPDRRSWFKLDVKQSFLEDNTPVDERENVAARAITAQWTDHFTKETEA